MGPQVYVDHLLGVIGRETTHVHQINNGTVVKCLSMLLAFVAPCRSGLAGLLVRFAVMLGVLLLRRGCGSVGVARAAAGPDRGSVEGF